ncbi:Transcriptional regulator, XRE family [uncultured Eubacteriales bacterium]|uniref:Transcriptional regulator, XRE family n=1 Tax=uncultured Eubacteriales bacterium TaxID=172733 RepID=A0A212JNN3_9FIRM|nr:Transcriptional regulator, XRE family [uncultured Eubacteriales bacterium]
MHKNDDETITDKLGEILKREREKAGYTREQIAERAKIGVRHLAAIENEQRMPSVKVLFRLIRAIGISADVIAYPETTQFETGEDYETSHLIRLIRICDNTARRAARAMLEVLCYSGASEDHK